MLEYILASGASRIYPESGPGNQILKYGDLELGYFGEVTSDELFTPQELSDLTQLSTTGTLNVTIASWFKFAYKGKFLFFPNRIIRRSVSWVQLYNAGLVYGEDNNGPLEDVIPQKGINQLQVVTKGQYRFKVRLIKSEETNPSNRTVPLDESVDQTNYFIDTEYNRLIYSLWETTAPLLGTSDWGSYSITYLGMNSAGARQIYTQEHYGSLEHVMTRGDTNSVTQVSAINPTSVSSTYGWRPILEVLPMNSFLADYSIDYNSAQALIPINDDLSVPNVQGTFLLPLDTVNVVRVFTEADEALSIYRDHDFEYTTGFELISPEQDTGLTRRAQITSLGGFTTESINPISITRDYGLAITTGLELVAPSEEFGTRSTDVDLMTIREQGVFTGGEVLFRDYGFVHNTQASLFPIGQDTLIYEGTYLTPLSAINAIFIEN